MRSLIRCAGLALLMPILGCEQDCTNYNGDQYEFFHGDRCPGLINEGALRLYPSNLVLPPSIGASETGVVSAAEVSVRGWIDASMTVPASGYVVEFILGSCTSPEEATTEPATLSLALAPPAEQEIQRCELVDEWIARCTFDSNGQASVRVIAGGALSPADEGLCIWARSGSEDKLPTQEKMEVRVGYGLDDLALKFEPRQAAPLGCGDPEMPCTPVAAPVLPPTVCMEGTACDALVQSVQLGIVTQYQGILQASGRDESVLLSLTSFGAGGRVWLASQADCGAGAATLQVQVDGDVGRSPDLWVCSDGLGGEVSIQAQSLTAPERAATVHARFAHIPAVLSAAVVVKGDLDADSGVYRLFVRDCRGQGLSGIELRGSLDGDQNFSAVSTSDAVGACLLAMPKDVGVLPDELRVRIDAWATVCALTIE